MRLQLFFIPIITCLLYIVPITANTVINDQNLRLHGYVPDNWVSYAEDDSTLGISDTSSEQKHSATLYITRYSLDGQSPEDWTRSFFIAQKLSLDYSTYSFSSVIYYDSSTNVKHQSSWAPEIYSRCISDDTLDFAWDEYTYFTATNEYGFEFHAIGDTTDMQTNIGLYMDILHSFIVDNGQTNSSNFLMSDLKTSPQIQFSPVFSPSIGTYTATVGVDINKISFTPYADQQNATISIQNIASTSGQQSYEQSLSLGSNDITIRVIAQDGTSIKTYTFAINRLSTNISVKRLPIAKGFDKKGYIPTVFDLRGEKIPANKYKKINATGVYLYKNATNATNNKQLFIK